MRSAVPLAALALLSSASATLEPRCKLCPLLVPECSSACANPDDVCITVQQSCDQCAKTTCLAPSDISKVAGPTVYPSIPPFTPLPSGSTAVVSSFSLMPLPPGVTPSPTGPRSSVQPGGPMSPVNNSTMTAAATTTSSASTSAAATAAAAGSTSATVSPNAAPIATPLGMGMAVLVGLGALL